ncbi:unnamed protein product [Colias eurytheme]|nr:unnamed protein product [Colias eurytheme]
MFGGEVGGPEQAVRGGEQRVRGVREGREVRGARGGEGPRRSLAGAGGARPALQRHLQRRRRRLRLAHCTYVTLHIFCRNVLLIKAPLRVMITVLSNLLY